jgi:LAS superfamily LD-carboxypeptidase LdcB
MKTLLHGKNDFPIGRAQSQLIKADPWHWVI